MTNVARYIKVLLVDDDRLVSEAMQMVLQYDGFKVSAADNGQQALELLEDFDPDIVITDIVMPDMDGLEFIRSVRVLNPEIPILAISGMGPEGGRLYLKQAEKAGANMTLSKPAKREKFIGSVKSLLGIT